jgi:hypothetical protein
MPTAIPNNPACTLLTKKDRSDMVGYSLNAELPVRPEPETYECMWVHSLREPARSAVSVTVIGTQAWARRVAPQLRAAMVKPTTGKALRGKLEAKLKELLTRGDRLPTEEVCEAYLLLAESRGATRSDQQVFYARIGSMPAAYAMACEEGIMTIVGYAEYGIGQSLALNRSVSKLAAAASGRAAEALAKAEDGADDTASPSPEADGNDEDASPSPEPTPTETDEADPEDEDES